MKHCSREQNHFREGTIDLYLHSQEYTYEVERCNTSCVGGVFGILSEYTLLFDGIGRQMHLSVQTHG